MEKNSGKAFELGELRFVIPHRLPGLNEVIAANRSHPKAGNNLKQKAQGTIAPYLPEWTLDGVYDIELTWKCVNKKRDPDNIYSAVKFILDAMVQGGVMSNDGWANVGSITNRRVLSDIDSVEVSLSPQKTED